MATPHRDQLNEYWLNCVVVREVKKKREKVRNAICIKSKTKHQLYAYDFLRYPVYSI